MKILFTYLFLLIMIIPFNDFYAQQDHYSQAKEFEFNLSHSSSNEHNNNNYFSNATFLFTKTENEGFYVSSNYFFYDKKLLDTLIIEIKNINEQINLSSDSKYQIYYETKPGWPSTFGLIIRKGNELVFEEITDWDIHKTVNLIDSSFIKVKFSKEYIAEADTTLECYKKIIPVQYEFSINNKSIYLRQSESNTLSGIKIYLGIARKIEYNNNCLDAGINGISFIAINKSIK